LYGIWATQGDGMFSLSLIFSSLIFQRDKTFMEPGFSAVIVFRGELLLAQKYRRQAATQDKRKNSQNHCPAVYIQEMIQAFLSGCFYL
jgi:hypothetical protein